VTESMQETQVQTAGVATPPQAKGWKALVSSFSTPLALIAGVIIWEVLGRTSHAVFFAPFSEAVQALGALIRSGELVRAATTSLQSLVLGIIVATALGLSIGIAMGLSDTVRNSLDLYINTFMAAPLIALIPIIAIFVGLDFVGRAAIVFLFSFFVITVNAEAGVKTTDPDLIEMAQSFCLSRRRIFTTVILPGAMPAILAGLRLGLVQGVKGMVTAEIFMAITGLGALLDYYGNQFKAAELFAVLFAVVAISMAVSSGFMLLSRRLTRWQTGIAVE
jgi:ABC-type nitrate/sulfonate/bicarbonate transport system permease component